MNYERMDELSQLLKTSIEQ